MAGFLVDVNLPYYFSLWNDYDYIHQADIDDTWSDKQIFEREGFLDSFLFLFDHT